MQEKLFVVDGNFFGMLGDHLSHTGFPAVNNLLLSQFSGKPGGLQEGADSVFEGLFVGSHKLVDWWIR